jgi:murein DD-endopeptidase MepM/ murein hydrolase activator NlpD
LPAITDEFLTKTSNEATCQTAIEGLVKDVKGTSLKEDFNNLATDPNLIDGVMTSLLPCFGIFDDCDDIILLLKRMHEVKLSKGKLFGKFKFKQSGKTFTGTSFTIDGIDVERMNLIYLGEANKEYLLTMAEYEVTETGFIIKQNGEEVIKIVLSFDDNSSVKKDLKNYLFWEKESTEITYSDPFLNPTLRKNSTNSNVGMFGCPRTVSDATCSYDDYPKLVMGNKSHHGLDILAEVGTELKSMYNGKVVDFDNTWAKKKESKNEDDNGCDYDANAFGNYVILKYELKEGITGIDGKKYNTIYAKFCHLDEVDNNIKKDADIKAGELLGTCGCSGNAGALKNVEFHLHLETNATNSFNTSTGARKINPESLFKNGIKK